jgi:hypothetical protein
MKLKGYKILQIAKKVNINRCKHKGFYSNVVNDDKSLGFDFCYYR